MPIVKIPQTRNTDDYIYINTDHIVYFNKNWNTNGTNIYITRNNSYKQTELEPNEVLDLINGKEVQNGN